MTYFYHIITLPVQLWKGFITSLPGPVGDKLRYWYWKKRLAFLGREARISEGVIIESPGDVSIGERTWIDRYVIILSGRRSSDPRHVIDKKNEHFHHQPGETIIGKECHIAPFSLLSGLGGLKIGDRTGVASGARIYSMSHHYRDPSMQDTESTTYSFTPMTSSKGQILISGPVTIGEDCAVGLNAVVLPGVNIENGTWVGVGESVTENLGKNMIFKGGRSHDKFKDASKSTS